MFIVFWGKGSLIKAPLFLFFCEAKHHIFSLFSLIFSPEKVAASSIGEEIKEKSKQRREHKEKSRSRDFFFMVTQWGLEPRRSLPLCGLLRSLFRSALLRSKNASRFGSGVQSCSAINNVPGSFEPGTLLVTQRGLEPRTFALKGRCSAN